MTTGVGQGGGAGKPSASADGTGLPMNGAAEASPPSVGIPDAVDGPLPDLVALHKHLKRAMEVFLSPEFDNKVHGFIVEDELYAMCRVLDGDL